MKISILFLCSLLLLFSCNQQQKSKSNNTDTTAKQDTFVPVQVTVLADLPDSLQPKIILWDTMPEPRIKTIDLTVSESKIIQVLRNEKNEPVLDANGNPFIMGTGGLSNFTNFTLKNGLITANIVCSLEDKNGNLWLGTWGKGLIRYDGKNFTAFSTDHGLNITSVTCIAEDISGNLWFGTEKGLVKYDGTSFIQFSNKEVIFSSTSCSIITDRKGRIWITADAGIFVYDGKSFTNFKNQHGLKDNSDSGKLYKDISGNIIYLSNKGMLYNDSGKLTDTIPLPDTFLVPGMEMTDVKQDKSGQLWVSSQNGAYCYDGKTVVHYTTAQGLVNNSIIVMTITKSGAVWFGTSGGISFYDGKKFTSYTTEQALTSNTVLSITEDNSGGIWITTLFNGISRFNGNAITFFNKDNSLLPPIVYETSMDREGNIWFTSIEGGIKYDGRSFSKFAYQNRANLDCFSITPDKYGNLWVMTLDGPAVQNQDNSFKMIKFPGTLGYGGVFHGDQKGNMWLAYPEIGLIKYDMARVEALLAGNQVPPQDLMDLKKDKAGQYIKSLTYFSTAQGLVDKEVKCITDDQAGNLWIGTTNGLSCFDGASFTNFTKSQGLCDNQILSIFTDRDGNIWFATAGGLNMLSKEASKRFLDNKQAKSNASKEIFLSFAPFGESFSSSIASIVQLPDGRIAFVTESGLTVFNLSKDLTKPQNISFYGEKTGYPIKNANRLFFDKLGMLWITTQDGDNPLIRFDINAIQKNTKPPTVIIQSLSVNDKNISWNSLHKASVMAKKDSLTTPASTLEETSVYGKVLTGQERDSLRNKFGGIQFNGITPFYPLPKKLKLPYQYNSVSFKFIASELGQNSLVRYSYMLEGYSKEWSNETDNTTATFGNISEGNYTFKLKAKTPEGTWSEPVTYTFTVLPPWWRTWWAYTIFALTFLFALRFFVKWRERNLRIEKEKLEKTVEIRTAEVVAEKKEVEKQKQEADKQRDEANRQRERSDELLLNILPEEVAEELKAKGSADAKQFDQVTVMFTDFKGFTQISEKLTPSELVAEIHTCFKAFDNIITKYNIEKIKTIGDAYMCAGGLPVTNTNHPVDVVHAALEIQQFMQAHLAQRKMEHKELFEMRIGIHTGPVVAGIVGVKKFAYDIWGDTVNTASRMESSGEAGKINISGSTYALVKDQFNCIHRGKISAKNKGEIDMYFVEGEE